VVVSRRHALTQVAVAAGGIEAYELLRRLLRPDWPVADRHAREVLDWERLAHVAWEAPLQAMVLRVPELEQLLQVFYLGAHFGLTAVFFVWLYRRSPAGFRRYRDGFLAATAIALVVHWRFPTAPPRLAGVGLVHPGLGLAGLSNPVAAVPSLHAGWALGVGIGVVRHARSAAWRAAGAAYPAAVVLTIVATGNHFVLDALAGMAVLGAGFAAAAVLDFGVRRGVEQSGSSPGS
jgi:PAP2 superfamily protein